MEWFYNLDLPLGIVIIIMIMSMALAIFHAILLKGVFELKIPTKIFFILNPSLILIGYFIYPPLSLLILAFLFLSIPVLMITGAIYSGYKGHAAKIRKNDKRLKKKTPSWKIALDIVVFILFIVGFYTFGGGIFFILFVYIILRAILPNKTNRFLRLQQTLPTSSIRSMAMGLVEVSGNLRMESALLAPLDATQCIGYRYTIESVSRDDEGRESFSTVSDEVVCNDFFISDDTGEVKVKGENLELLWIPQHLQKRRNGQRHTQYLMRVGDNMLLIGMATNEGQEVFIRKEDIKNVFMIAPVDSIDKWNKYKPLLNAFIITCAIIAIIMSLIFVADISVDNGIVHIYLKNIFSNNL